MQGELQNFPVQASISLHLLVITSTHLRSYQALLSLARGLFLVVFFFSSVLINLTVLSKFDCLWLLTDPRFLQYLQAKCST